MRCGCVRVWLGELIEGVTQTDTHRGQTLPPHGCLSLIGTGDTEGGTEGGWLGCVASIGRIGFDSIGFINQGTGMCLDVGVSIDIGSGAVVVVCG